MEKRHGLEEAKPASVVKSGTPPSFDHGFPGGPSMPSNLSYQNDQLENHGETDHRLLAQPRNPVVWDGQMIGQFWNRYAGLKCHGPPSPCVWLKQIISLPERGEAVEFSLKALAMTRLGHVTQDDSLIRQGNINYGGALQSVQKGLWHSEMMMRDELFLAGYMLVIYEVGAPCLALRGQGS